MGMIFKVGQPERVQATWPVHIQYTPTSSFSIITILYTQQFNERVHVKMNTKVNASQQAPPFFPVLLLLLPLEDTKLLFVNLSHESVNGVV